ncbi:MAG: PASTA domain-containing protein [Oscillospiraceae bacterium]|nr:PASTA domain-containing protein [Oscillospiraceae bacterium]
MQKKIQLCVSCMKDIQNSNICENCGYDQDTLYLPGQIPPKTIFLERYFLGKLLSEDKQGATYIAFDLNINQVVEIKEYLPEKICVREKDSLNIIPMEGLQTPYKAYLSDFIELYKELSKIRTLSHIVKIYDVIELNNTAYAICERVIGQTLKQFLMDNVDYINWDLAKEIITPVIKSVGILHSVNIIHRGISTETLLINKKNEIKLTSFSINLTRGANSSLNFDLFSGYSAPEQYFPNGTHGTWTDIYSISAVLYKIVTGTMPPDAYARMSKDKYVSANKLNLDITDYLSNILDKALNLSIKDRISSINELQSYLTNPDCYPPIIQPEKPLPISEKTKSQKNKKYGLISMGITTIFLLFILIFVFVFLFDSPNKNNNNNNLNSFISNNSSSISTNENSSSFSSSSSSSIITSNSSQTDVNKISVPNFINQNYTSIKNNPTYKNLFSFIIKEEYNDDFGIGKIFEQNIAPNSEVIQNTSIILKVSKGKRFPTIPDFYGISGDEYTKTLKDLGINYEIQREKVSNLPSGYVFNTSITPGNTIDIESSIKLVIFITK